MEAEGAVEIVRGAGGSGLVLSCEHASNRVPPPWRWPAEDDWLVASHWAWDPGAANITRSLASRLGIPAVLASFSRLLVDPNRRADHPTLFRDVADGRQVHLNEALSSEERSERMDALYHPYHQALGELVRDNAGANLLSVHSFTRVYEGGPPREMEIGVLFDHCEELARRLGQALADDGWVVALNEPYTGRGGMMYSVDHHARCYGRSALELEVRQDLATDPAVVSRLVTSVVSAVRRSGLVG